jgi:putative hydrolase of the HAD superfamily
VDLALVDPAMALFSEARSTVTLFDDVEPALLRLKDKLTLGSVSNGFADLERIGLAGHRRLHRRPSLRSRQARSGHLPRRLRGTAGGAGATVYVGDDPLLDVGARRPACGRCG